jgi:hypothetical protein
MVWWSAISCGAVHVCRLGFLALPAIVTAEILKLKRPSEQGYTGSVGTLRTFPASDL